MYTGDLIMFSSNANTAVAVVQDSLNFLSVYLQHKDLNISPSKSQYMIFFRKRSIPAFHYLKVDNCNISVIKFCKFLDVWFDRKMLGKTHLIYLLNKGSHGHSVRSLVGFPSSLY